MILLRILIMVSSGSAGIHVGRSIKSVIIKIASLKKVSIKHGSIQKKLK